MPLYELNVFDDGECAVRKISKRPLFAYNAFFSTLEELKDYFSSALSLRWPMEDILARIAAAQEYEWTEFK